MYILPFAAFGLFSGKKWLNTVARYAAIFVAVYFGILGIRGVASYYFSSGDVVVDNAGDSPHAEVFNAMEEDTLYILTFPEMEEDRGRDMFADLRDSGGPVFVLVESTENRWNESLASIPELSGVIGPWWMDFRSGAELQPWQIQANELAASRNFRLFAVEYEPMIPRGRE